MSKVAPSSSAEGPEQITFAEDGSSKKKSGVRRPVFAELLSCEAEATPKPGRVHLLVNPFSGRKRGKKVGAAARKLLEAAGVEVELHPRIVAGRVIRIDLAEVDLRSGTAKRPGDALRWYSHNLVTWGLGVDSVVLAERMRWLGPARYDVGIVIKILANVRRRATLTVDGHAMEDDYTLFLIQNTQTGGAGLRRAGAPSTTARGAVFHPSVGSHRFELAIDTPAPTAINIDGELAGVTP
ncbi:D-erythro-sphingosine kinase [Aureococcus anophagefferens]|nr:D-erythro-sphingosine kinase [Aureococcus anophagefferens]